MTLTDASHVRNTGPMEQQTITETLLQDERAPASSLPPITMAEGRMHLDLSPDSAVMIDALGRIVLVNEQATTLFGYGQDELNGHPLEVLLPERFHTAHMAHLAPGTPLPEPTLSDPELHRQHRLGMYRPRGAGTKSPQLLQLPSA